MAYGDFSGIVAPKGLMGVNDLITGGQNIRANDTEQQIREMTIAEFKRKQKEEEDYYNRLIAAQNRPETVTQDVSVPNSLYTADSLIRPEIDKDVRRDLIGDIASPNYNTPTASDMYGGQAIAASAAPNQFNQGMGPITNQEFAKRQVATAPQNALVAPTQADMYGGGAIGENQANIARINAQPTLDAQRQEAIKAEVERRMGDEKYVPQEWRKPTVVQQQQVPNTEPVEPPTTPGALRAQEYLTQQKEAKAAAQEAMYQKQAAEADKIAGVFLARAEKLQGTDEADKAQPLIEQAAMAYKRYGKNPYTSAQATALEEMANLTTIPKVAAKAPKAGSAILPSATGTSITEYVNDNKDWLAPQAQKDLKSLAKQLSTRGKTSRPTDVTITREGEGQVSIKMATEPLPPKYVMNIGGGSPSRSGVNTKPVFNKQTQQLEYVSNDDINRENAAARKEGRPPVYAPASQQMKANSQEALIEDIRGSINTVRGSLDKLPEFTTAQRAQMAVVLKHRDPSSALSQFMGSQWAKGLTPEQVNYVTDLVQLKEQILGMRTVLGAGQGSKDLRAAVEQTIPGAMSPDKKYAKTQLDKAEQVLDRVTRGVARGALRPEPEGKRVVERRKTADGRILVKYADGKIAEEK